MIIMHEGSLRYSEKQECADREGTLGAQATGLFYVKVDYMNTLSSTIRHDNTCSHPTHARKATSDSALVAQ